MFTMNKSKRNSQQQIWADKEFVDWLKRIKGKLEGEGIEVGSIGDLTRQIVKTKSVDDLERQILNSQNISELKIKMDSRRIFS